MSALAKTGLLLFGSSGCFYIGKWLRTGQGIEIDFKLWRDISFALLVLAGPYKLYLACLMVAWTMYLLTDASKRYFFSQSLTFWRYLIYRARPYALAVSVGGTLWQIK